MDPKSPDDGCLDAPINAKVAFLRSPDAYADRPPTVEVTETHMSWVFLAGQLAYKLKKPVRYEFLDFSTVEARRKNCEREIELNRRLAGDVYCGVVPLVINSDGRLQLGGQGNIVDWLVKMRRLPAHQMLDVAIRASTVGSEDLRRLADVLIKFYRHATPVAMGATEYRQRFEEGIRVNQRELSLPYGRLDTQLIDRLTRAELDFVVRNHDLLERRARDQRIVDAHGDLRPEHVCLEPTPIVIDCLEFKRELRLLDPVDELAYLAMECERLAGAVAGTYLLQQYFDGTGDRPPAELVWFYKAFRACLRARLAIWHLADDGIRDTQKWRRRACDYLGLAASYVASW